jgi:tyrosinase
MSEPIRVRRDIWDLERARPWHPITRAYALAVAELQQRADADPTSWVYQAQIHDMADGTQPDVFRGQCQHMSWFFLPWHRLYLYWFERIIRRCVTEHPDVDAQTKANWALPYWNYSAGGVRATLPEAFRAATMPDGTPNALFTEERNKYINDGFELPTLAIRIDRALAPTAFSMDSPDGGFGGAPTGWNHFDLDFNTNESGALEQVPHGAVHVEVGGFMAGFDTAALDPVFWLHHANIDRLWEAWRRTLGNPNPDAASPWGATAFAFHDEHGKVVAGSAADALDTAADLNYRYASISVPPPVTVRRGGGVPPQAPPPSDTPAELVGATEGPIEIAGERRDVSFSIGDPTGPSARTAGTPARVILAIEGIQSVEPGRKPDVTYAVYVNLPDDADAGTDPESFYAGTLDLFGLERAGSVTNDRPGHGLRRSFDITDIYERLREEGRWDPGSVTVSFQALRPGGSDRQAAGDTEERTATPVRFGRVAVYVG